MTVLVASTVRGYKARVNGNPEDMYLAAWLTHGEAWRDAGHRFFLAVQEDHVVDDALDYLARLVESLGGTVWRFTLDEPGAVVNNSARLSGICAGRNLAHEFAQRDLSVEAILFLDTDVAPPLDAVERLTEVDHPVVGGHVPTYCLDGPSVYSLPCGHLGPFPHSCNLATPPRERRFLPRDADVREHWTSAGFLLVRREVFRRVRWRWDYEGNATDDPCFAADVEAAGFGPEWVRHDVVGRHFPEFVVPFDERGHDLAVK